MWRMVANHLLLESCPPSHQPSQARGVVERRAVAEADQAWFQFRQLRDGAPVFRRIATEDSGRFDELFLHRQEVEIRQDIAGEGDAVRIAEIHDVPRRVTRRMDDPVGGSGRWQWAVGRGSQGAGG